MIRECFLFRFAKILELNSFWFALNDKMDSHMWFNWMRAGDTTNECVFDETLWLALSHLLTFDWMLNEKVMEWLEAEKLAQNWENRVFLYAIQVPFSYNSYSYFKLSPDFEAMSSSLITINFGKFLSRSLTNVHKSLYVIEENFKHRNHINNTLTKGSRTMMGQSKGMDVCLRICLQTLVSINEFEHQN